MDNNEVCKKCNGTGRKKVQANDMYLGRRHWLTNIVVCDCKKVKPSEKV